ncbi:DEAD/DEAH box helicase family protein [Polaribacter sp. MSW13]|uniref:DEAD/DEAH box helicase family protein n=1 Tax=Polaribacter marinus TaxID=2916838 RepID=A0A9X1VPF3_9FLAO|nr:DEAD/DEAH box helicase family protein [Polaribacter marinus]MCI2230349.1 DEAD/DEAH box helicase family protein [Polaribacter marinus]
MELKKYQQEVINDLTQFIEELDTTRHLSNAFSNFWESKGISVQSLEDDFLRPYDNSIKGVPRVTVKVPTAGGKTFIACNALKPIFDSFPLDKPQVVVWFVPSDTILKQTYKNLKDTSHPYRQKIDAHFNGNVKVYDKEALLFGQGFNPVEVKEQLSILVLSVQSFVETVRKGLPRAYRENENLAEFVSHFRDLKANLDNVDDTALIQVIAYLNPVIVIDESHNFEADLRIEMLNNINPSFIFDLTATPRNKSNIISFVDAIKLKKNNMVKLPVIVYNHQDTTEVLSSAIQMQKTLEAKAKTQEANGGKYIRPIVLFQAQPKTKDDNITFDKIKSSLMEIGIPESQIKIKTANKDEIKNLDLLSRDCEVRYIITVNALKEGWDCPFAYVLASLANKSSSIDVEQILGRVLRLPYVTKHKEDLLNYSYVFTSSNNFLDTLDKIILGLNKSGFSAKDYRVKEQQIESKIDTSTGKGSFEDLFGKEQEQPSTSNNDNDDTEVTINVDDVKQLTESEKGTSQLEDILKLAGDTNAEFEKKMEELEKEDNLIPTELKEKIKSFPIKEVFKEDANKEVIPTFHIKTAPSLIEPDNLIPLTKNLLLDGFELDKQNSDIDLTRTASKMASIDLAEGRKDEYVPEYKYVDNHVKEAFAEYLSTLTPEQKINQIAGRITKIIKKIDQIPEPQIIAYIKKIIENLNSDKIAEITNNEPFYAKIIKNRITELSNQHMEKQFDILLDKGTVLCQPSFKFSKKISPKNTLKGITKNLYIEEGEMNDFERQVINEVANLDSVVYWHRNLERGKGLLINGFVNHYPDFIVKMKNGKTILVETKGDHLDGSDSQQKLRLGEKWASKAGDNYRYFMVFKSDKLDGARTVAELIDILKDMK